MVGPLCGGSTVWWFIEWWAHCVVGSLCGGLLYDGSLCGGSLCGGYAVVHGG